MLNFRDDTTIYLKHECVVFTLRPTNDTLSPNQEIQITSVYVQYMVITHLVSVHNLLGYNYRMPCHIGRALRVRCIGVGFALRYRLAKSSIHVIIPYTIIIADRKVLSFETIKLIINLNHHINYESSYA